MYLKLPLRHFAQDRHPNGSGAGPKDIAVPKKSRSSVKIKKSSLVIGITIAAWTLRVQQQFMWPGSGPHLRNAREQNTENTHVS